MSRSSCVDEMNIKCCGAFKRILFFFYAFSLLSNFVTSISYVVTLWQFPHTEKLQEDTKETYLLITQILCSVATGMSALTQVWILFKKEFYCRSIVMAPAAAVTPTEWWQELSDQKGSWPVFKLGIWKFFSSDCIQLASSLVFFRVLKDYAPFSQKVAAFFKIIFTLIMMGIFLFIEVPLKTCCHRAGKSMDKTANKLKRQDKSKTEAPESA
eukprot:gene9796-11443_t